MINLGELIHDPDFCDTFVIIRHTESTWEKGRQEIKTKRIMVEGIVAPANSRDLETLPEGDRNSGMKAFYADKPFHITDTQKMSDVCIFRGHKYKLLQVFDYSSNGYYKAIGTLTEDEDDDI